MITKIQNGEVPKAVFKKWWLGTDGTYFGLFLESPWPFVLAWSCFGFSSFLDLNDKVAPDALAIVMFIICLLQGVDAGILIQQNLYAGNMKGKNMFSLPFVLGRNSIHLSLCSTLISLGCQTCSILGIVGKPTPKLS